MDMATLVSVVGAHSFPQRRRRGSLRAAGGQTVTCAAERQTVTCTAASEDYLNVKPRFVFARRTASTSEA